MLELSPFNPLGLTLMALFSPLVIAIGFLMGRLADQWHKIIVAGFAAAVANAVLIWFAVRFGVLAASGIGGEAGLFVLSLVFGTAWAAIGYITAPVKRSQK